jgi:hypothetical protein
MGKLGAVEPGSRLEGFLTTEAFLMRIRKLKMHYSAFVDLKMNWPCLVKQLSHSVVDNTGSQLWRELIYWGASVCILFNWTEGIYFPSKLADYIASRQPVIALSPEIGVAADMLPCHWMQRADVDDSIAIKETIAYFYGAY